MKPKGATECRKCATARTEARYDEAEKIVAAGVCPLCGSALWRNIALTGWWQCGRFGEPERRKPEYRFLPRCEFQTFTRS